MKFIINNDKLIKSEDIFVNSGSINYYIADVVCNEIWKNLSIKAIIVPKDGSEFATEGISIPVIDNQVYIDNKINGVFGIGFIGYTVENNKKVYQISTNLINIYFKNGAGEIKATNESNIPTPNQWEMYIKQIEILTNGLREEIPTKISDLINDNYTVQDKHYVHTDNNFTNVDKNNLNLNTEDRHFHSNKEVLDTITAQDIIDWNNKDVSNLVTQSEFSGEITNRENADINLQRQIDALVVSSDVIDVVGTYTDLENYNTQHVKENDIIKVLQDSTHNNEMTYYRWIIVDHVGSWSYVGSEGSTYTKSEVNTLLNDKQNTIDSSHKLLSDLVDDTNQTNKFVTSSDKTTWNGKQDALVSGTNIKTINNESILGSGNITISGGSSIDVHDSYSTSTTEPYSANYINNLFDFSQNGIRVGTWVNRKTSL